MQLRPVTLEDARVLLEWRNDPLTRENSRTTDEVLWEDHRGWIERSLTNPDRKLYIALHGGVPVGTVRADFHDGRHELSWTASPGARGYGIGGAMVKQFVNEVLPGAPLLASIKKGNIASEKIAQALGLSPGGQEFPDDKGPHPLILWK
ncbi:N-acetyltransferase [Candidatus Kaiserbacteria bacterium]|nr:N-acetyltransferase [Candidatus Kaiserbacteria bacterium]